MFITIIVDMNETDESTISIINDKCVDKKNKTYGGIFRSNFLNLIYFHIRNGTYEISTMWCLIVTTIILLLSLVIKDAEDEEETLRAL